MERIPTVSETLVEITRNGDRHDGTTITYKGPVHPAKDDTGDGRGRIAEVSVNHIGQPNTIIFKRDSE
jgi:hypothetical protein